MVFLQSKCAIFVFMAWMHDRYQCHSSIPKDFNFSIKFCYRIRVVFLCIKKIDHSLWDLFLVFVFIVKTKIEVNDNEKRRKSSKEYQNESWNLAKNRGQKIKKMWSNTEAANQKGKILREKFKKGEKNREEWKIEKQNENVRNKVLALT